MSAVSTSQRAVAAEDNVPLLYGTAQRKAEQAGHLRPPKTVSPSLPPPDYWTQGETIDELEENLRDIYSDITGGLIPSVRMVQELIVA